MLRPQGLFQNRMPAPAEWQPPHPPAPGSYPPGRQYPQGNPYQQGGAYPQPGQYPATGASQQAAPPWPQGPTGVLPAVPGGPTQPGYPGGQYPQGGAYQGPYGNGQYPGGQYGQDQFPPGQFPPGQFPQGGNRLLDRLPGNRRLIPVAVAAGIAIVVVVALVLSSKGGSSPGSASGGTAANGSPTASSSAGATTLTQRQAATALAGLLAQSGTDHSDVNAAVTNVQGCKSLTADAQTFGRAAANRGTLLSKLARLPGRSALPSAMLTDLTNGWQASATVDADLGKWAAAEVGHCKKNDLKNANYVASLPYDSQATNGKTEFVRLWNGLARKQGLAVYQPSQI